MDPFALAKQVTPSRGLPPVHLWNPAFCGDIDMKIAADGTWFYQGTPIGRPAMVKLFSTILRRDPDRFVLVTPVERVGITVEDAPFIATSLTAESEGNASVQRLTFTTNVEDEVTADSDHPLRFEPDSAGGLRPYVLVRGDLWARLNRVTALDLMARVAVQGDGDAATCGVWSSGTFFAMGLAKDLLPDGSEAF